MSTFAKFNYLLTVVPILLFSLGYITLLSTSVQTAHEHLLFFVLGLVIFVVFSFIDVSVLFAFSKHLYLISVVLLVFTFILGEVTLGSTRWLKFGNFTFQPSEILKVALILYLPTYLKTKNYTHLNIKSLLKTVFTFLPAALLVLIQPDFGSFFVIFMTFVIMLYGYGLNTLYFILAFIGLGILSTPIWNALHEYQKYRILVFINPALDVLGRGYNVIQSIISIGSGGFFGKGFGRGTPTHLNYLPVYWTDFVFAAFAEEWGMLGSLILIFLYCLLLATILFVSIRMPSKEMSLVCIGVFAVLFIQFFVNLGMNMGLLPVTGITLPLLSSGGTSILVSMFLLGLVNSIWLHKLN